MNESDEDRNNEEETHTGSPFYISKVVFLPGRTPGHYHGVTMATASSVWLNLITPTR